MTAFVEECRREWRRLGVPDLLADEMATDLEADLEEAQADGVSAAEILGESDPRRFAATWASERGLVSEQPRRKSRKRFWIWLTVGFVLIFLLGAAAAGGLLATATVSVQPVVTPPAPRTVRSVRVPNLLGLRACHAERIARTMGFSVERFSRARCNAVVIGQTPAGGQVFPWRAPRPRLRLQLRRVSG